MYSIDPALLAGLQFMGTIGAGAIVLGLAMAWTARLIFR